MRRSQAFVLAAALGVAALAGCTSGNSAIQPPYQSANISQIGKLQFAVGTATIQMVSSGSPAAVEGLNTVETFRKTDGTSATAVNMPAITGPAGFKVPNSCQAQDDAGTNTISGSPQNSSGSTTFGTVGQATLYGFGPNNYGSSGSAPFGDYALPFYYDILPGSTCASSSSSSSSGAYPTTTFYGVGPAFPTTSVGGFIGYNLGFVDFAATPVSGSYALAVTIPTSPGSSQSAYTYHASANMSATRVLPVFSGVGLVGNVSGGGSVKVSLPAGATEAYVQIEDLFTGALFGFSFHNSATQTLADGSMSPCDVFEVTGVAFDYPALEAAAPKSTSQTPKIVGPHGQDDISVSFPNLGQMPPPSSSSGCSSARTRGHRH